MKKTNHITFLVVTEFIFLLILYKVLFIPITHDETHTIWYYCGANDVWSIMMYPDGVPNNHILNSLLAKACMAIFGIEQWAARLPNLLSFLLYAWAVFRIVKNVFKSESVFFIPAMLLFYANPYMLDFFGLCRGYGMSCAICLFSASYLITGFQYRNNRHIWIALIFSILASYANFSLLVFWLATTLMVIFYFYSQWRTGKIKFLKPFLVNILIFIAYAALIAVPVYKMQTTDQFRFWTSQGFYRETILPLIIHSLYGSQRTLFVQFNAIAYLVLGIVAANFIYVILKFRSSKYSLQNLNSPVFVATLLLILTAGINYLQCKIMHTPNLNGRTALFFYPLFIAAFVTTFSLFTKYKAALLKTLVAAGITFLCIFHLADTMSLTRTKEWWLDENTFKVTQFLKDTYGGQDVSLKTNWLFHPSFYFYEYAGKNPWLKLGMYDKNIDINTDAEYYYVLEEDYPILESKFEPVIIFDNKTWLLKKRDTIVNDSIK